jgi:DNA sulfur modification protein DndC
MLEQVLTIQGEVNRAARAQGMPEVVLINEEELTRIEELMAANTWPNQWDGTEARGDAMLPEVLPDGNVQQLLFEEDGLWG